MILLCLGVHLNVYTYDEDNGVLPYFLDPRNPQRAIDILFFGIEEEEEEPEENGEVINATGHYVLIKNLSRLISTEVNNHHGEKHICKRCFAHFYNSKRKTTTSTTTTSLSFTGEGLENHIPDCNLLSGDGNGVIKKFPFCVTCTEFTATCETCRRGAVIKFSNIEKQLPQPCYLVADFESYLSGTQHKLMAFGIYVIVADEYKDLQCFSKLKGKMIQKFVDEMLEGEDLGSRFLKVVLPLAYEIKEIIKRTYLPLRWRSEAERGEYENSTTCGICGQEITDLCE